MRVNKRLFVPLCLSLAGFAAAAAPAPLYTIVDLGVLGADAGSAALGMSPGGIVTGRSSSATTFAGFSWTAQGGMSTLPGQAGRSYNVANGANDLGTVVGTSSTTGAGAGALPLMWQNGALSQLALPAGQTLGKANDVNASNVAVGSVSSGTAERAVVYANGSASLVPLLANGGQMVTAYAINNSGWAVGYGTDPANSQLRVGLVYDTLSGTSFSIGTLAGKNGAIAYDVNASGQVVGAAMQNAGGAVPMVWTQAGGMQAIPLLAGTTLGTARSVNASGWAVGTMGVGNLTPFLYDGSASYSLADLIPAGSGWTLPGSLSSAMGISDGGVIAGTATFNGATHAYAMIPTAAVPEPGNCALMLAGLAAIGWVARRRGEA